MILTAVFSLSLAGLVIYQLAANGTLVLNGQSQGILSILVVGASVDYALLLVARYREELHHVEHPATAMRRALRACIEPIAASAGTVIAGVLCLLLSDLGSNRSLGPVAAIGIASAFLGSLTLLPALLLVLGKRSRALFWPRAPRADALLADGAVNVTDPSQGTGVWARLARFVGRKDRTVWILTAVALAVGAAFLPTLNASGTNQVDVFLTDVDAVAGEEVLAEHFPAGAVQPAIVIVDEADVDAVTTAAEGVDGVEGVTPYTGAPAGAGAPDTGAPPIVVDGRVRLDVTTTASADTQDAAATVQELRTAVSEVSPSAVVGGAAAEKLDTNLASERDLRVIVPVVLLVIGLILMLLLRSILAAVLLLLANVLSFAAALGVSAIFFNHVFGFAGADPVVPLFAFVFLIALGVDYSIFLMTRVREESVKVGTRAGVVRGLAVTGGVITSAGHRAGHHVRGPRGHPAAVPGADRVHRRVRGAPGHARGAQPAGARAGARHRPRDLVAQRPVEERRARPAEGRRRPRVSRMEALRVGLVGYGGAGRGIHARLLREAGQRVSAVVTRSRAEQVEADWPGARRRPRRRRAARARRPAGPGRDRQSDRASTWRTCWRRSTPVCTCSSTSPWRRPPPTPSCSPRAATDA